jgi:RES domain-containing protein
MLEILVHLQLEDGQAPPSYTLLRVVAPDDLGAPVLYDPVYDNWKTDLDLTRQLGDAWLKAQSSAITRVPSAILPLTYNYLLNPLHTDAPRVEIVSSHQGVFDERLIWR